jgi:hypothetical protein
VNKGVPQLAFDFAFMAAEGDEETVAIQVAKDPKTRMIFANVVPRKGLASMHGVEEMIKDIATSGYTEARTSIKERARGSQKTKKGPDDLGELTFGRQ